MQKLIFILALAALLCPLTPSQSLSNNTMEGRQFIIAIPPNEATGVNIIQRALEIYVTSRVDTEVTIEMPGLGFGPLTKKVKALEVTTFSGEANELSWAMEVRESEVVTEKALIITAKDPVSVWVLSAKRFCSEGYAARPLSTWGTDYRHLGYYDYPEVQTLRGGGFVVVAQEDQTDITLFLQGSDAGGSTVGGKKPGDRISITLNRGQSYMIRGNGMDRAFDLTGTRITAEKPIGVIAFHERTIIPTAMGQSSRDNLIEMLPPVEAAGKQHVSLEFDRENRGDYFRILATENNTNYEIRSYAADADKELISVRNGLLTKAGDWAEFEEVNPQDESESIRGTTVWESDKPTVVMQYSYSSGWDGNQDFDPNMMLVPAVEQFTRGGHLFSAPSNADFNTNWVNIFVAGLVPQGSPTELRKVVMDGTPVFERFPEFLENRIPGTNIHWARINVAPGAHQITSTLPVATSIYGFSRFESYAWTDGIATNFLESGDVDAPDLNVLDSDRFSIDLEITDNRPTDIGLAAVEMAVYSSTNMEIEYRDDITLGGEHAKARIRLDKIEPDKDANALIIAWDRAGNLDSWTFELETAAVEFEPRVLDFGRVRVGEFADQALRISNTGSLDLTLNELGIEANSHFSAPDLQLPLDLAIGESVEIPVRYAPTEETARTDIDDDETVALARFSSDFDYQFELRGQGGLPHLEIIEAKFPDTEIETSSCQDPGLTLTNVGTWNLTISEIAAIEAPFELRDDIPTLPLVLAPGEILELGPICFAPSTVGVFEQEVLITSDDAELELQVALLSATAEFTSPVHEPLVYENSVKLSPNPASNMTRITWSTRSAAELNLRVVDIRGQVVLERALGLTGAGTQSMDLTLSALPLGSYFVELYGAHGSHTQNLVISR